MKAAVVLDACVVIKLFVKEKNSEDAFDLFKFIVENDMTILTPHLFLYELVQGVSKHREDIEVWYSNYENKISRYV